MALISAHGRSESPHLPLLAETVGKLKKVDLSIVCFSSSFD